MHALARLTAHYTLASYGGSDTKENLENLTKIVDNLSKEQADKLVKLILPYIEQIKASNNIE